MVNSSIIIPMFVALIGIIGTITPVLMNKYYESANKPFINVDIETLNNHTASAQISNTGSSPATNISLLIEAPKKIVNVIDLLNTGVTKTSQNFSQNILKMQIAKFIQGSGSRLKFEMLFDESRNNIRYANYNYSAFVIYDQGSNSVRIPLTTLDMLNEIYGSFNGFPGIAYLYLVLIPISILLIKRKRKKQKRKRFVDEMMNNLLKVRSTIKSEPMYRSILEDINTKDISVDTGLSLRIYWSIFEGIKNKNTSVDTNLRSVFDPQDYIIINDFNIVLKLRNEYISNNSIIDENRLQKLNDDCLHYAEKALKDIDWKKYSS